MSDDFLKESIKKKPVNKGKIIKKMVITILCAIIFGIIASVIIFVLEPFIAKKLTKETSETVTPSTVSFSSDDTEEMSPEEMLAEYMQQESALADELNADDTDSAVAGDSYSQASDPSEVTEPIAEETQPEFPLSEDQVSQILSQVSLDRTNYRQLATAMTAYYREISKYIVTITSSTEETNWLDATSENEHTVSGVIVANNQVDLLILADASFIDTDGSTTATFNDGNIYEAELKGIDPDTGYGIFGVSINSISADTDLDSIVATLGNSVSLYVGMPVIAVGSTMGVSGSMGYGMLNMPKSTINMSDWYKTVLYTDICGASNSSGVLFNLYGQVVGIITDSENNNSGNTLIKAYGISELKSRIEKISNEQGIPYVGLVCTDVPDDVRTEQNLPEGIYVTEVKMDSPAMMVGIQVGDMINSIDGEEIDSYSDYVKILNEKEIGNQINITVNRKTQEVYTEITFTLNILSK